jgi:hypothetical protein
MELRRVVDELYAGVGSRETPDDVCRRMRSIARLMADAGWGLRSGHARGADLAFEDGCDDVMGSKEIWVPYMGFGGSMSMLTPQPNAFVLAEQFHPNWSACNDFSRLAHARNAHIILGDNLQKPVDHVSCWTKDGLGEGGTGQAIRIARHYGIPVYDFAIPGTTELLRRRLA